MAFRMASSAFSTRSIAGSLSSQPAATCGKVCIAEVEEIVPVGSLDPDCIHLPSIFVNRLIDGSPYEKQIEFRTVREREAA